MSASVKQPKSSQAVVSLQDIDVIKIISKSRFNVYLVKNQHTNEQFAMKVFPYQKGQIHPSYSNESKLTLFDHPNVIKAHKINETQSVSDEK
mmetsp:Transcript_15068/g.12782  ORF Transcript_15068/g.12782 Transcript_15068/m.12782 type:complete len:92 (-) Transcript_15068:1075-1350(-)|eukprot:CAMPEP_0114582586 /NCGR_PEP_ID=MMETSP0125-20121206/6531_1 /TAXON_ID=485358 ORGANISM="Aristerostoma sp., Strain ATCC 50986" /NCGR_SAMPLE_ID=MMETSP0125 /ASSEMBLY_ACC=CAM_ASM_000245 /LENGTH=91 /DNA_ID=CAMNT_0001775615 /DNA_START=81 /DNA_END=356 /DNA_ORIENTATION=-